MHAHQETVLEKAINPSNLQKTASCTTVDTVNIKVLTFSGSGCHYLAMASISRVFLRSYLFSFFTLN